METEALSSKDTVTNFIEKITKADGDLIPLPERRSKLNEPFFISARIGKDEVNPEIKYLNVDLFAEGDEEFLPIGIYDWEISGDLAVGNKQRHGHLPCSNQAQRNADRFWATGEAFHVIDTDFLRYAMDSGGFEKMNELREAGIVENEDEWAKPIYQGMGLGSLMIAVSSLALHHHGVKKMDLGTLSKKAELAWKKFDRGERQEIATQELVEHPRTPKILERFLIQ